MDNEKTIFNFLCNNMNLNKAAACGILANIEAESSFNPNLYGDYGTSYGICQWHNSRFTQLRNWCSENNKSHITLDGQLYYLKHELETSYRKLLNSMKTIPNTKDGAYDVAYMWCTDFEIPANALVKAIERGRLAQEVYWVKYSTANFKESEGNAKMAVDVNKVLEIALSEVGYLEKASNSQLDHKTANAGHNNYTKYARDLDKISGFYNGKKNGYAWCDVWVDWVFVKAFGVEVAKKLLCQPNNSAGAGCTFSMGYYKQKGQFHSSPKVGDQIFFGAGSESTHTGLVYKVDNSYVYTIEGNTSSSSGVVANGGAVCKKSYVLNYGYILGYGRPNYNMSASSNTIVNTTTTTRKTTCTVTLNQLSRGDTGAQVVALQALLIAKGYDCGKYGADGDFGNDTYLAVIKFQRAKNLEDDGICGANTWDALLKG